MRRSGPPRSARRNCGCCSAGWTVSDVVEFSVLDSGNGLAPEVMDRLYEAFYSTKTDGMGIGLNLCRSIVESHQGRMRAENLYNGADLTGCCFSFWIPVGQPQTGTAAPKSQQLKTPG
jgi:signal transduction histidine kinase